MFTGIVKELGTIRNISGLGNIYKISVDTKDMAKELGIGDSVAVNGTCLTLIEKVKNTLTFDVMAETLRKTSLGRLRIGDAVNLEEPLRAGTSIGGHFVTGHTDCTGRIRDIRRSSGETAIDITFPEEYSHLVVEKGSIALDGISLTVGKVSKNCLTVYVIPHTLKVTTLGAKRSGDDINIEFDTIGKYVAKLFEKTRIS